MTRVVFMGAKTVGARCFQILLRVAREETVEIAGVLTRPTKLDRGLSVDELCEALDIPQLESLDEYLALPSVDVAISVQHDQILKTPHLQKPSDLAVNLHMAPLPEYRGCNQFSFAILDEADWFGATLHVMSEDVDAGDILAERRFRIPDNCWVKELYDRTVDASVKLFEESISDLLNGQYTRTPQEDLVDERGTSYHYRDEIEEIKHIRLHWKEERIQRHIRATAMPGFEPPYTEIDGRRVHLRPEQWANPDEGV
jgi:methionyl-tRNA formyltransferase